MCLILFLIQTVFICIYVGDNASDVILVSIATWLTIGRPYRYIYEKQYSMNWGVGLAYRCKLLIIIHYSFSLQVAVIS